MKNKALELAAQGHPVFPLFPGKKTPALPNWQKLATCDPDTIMDWWSGTRKVTNQKGKSWIIPSNANIGIHTTGLCVLDIDVKDGTTAGMDSLKTLPPAKTLISKTPTDGLHIIFKLPVGTQVSNRANWLKNVDIRGDLGYIVAPGSTIGGKAYELVNPDVPIAMIQPDLLFKIGTKASTDSDLGASSDFSTLPDSIPAGGRDDAVYKHCCSMRARSMSRDDALVRLAELYKRIEQPEGDVFTWAEAIAKLDQAWLLPAGTPQDIVAEQVAPQLQAPVVGHMTLSQMLIQYVFIINGSLVGDLNNRKVVKLGDFNNQMKPVRERNANDKMIEVSKTWMTSKARQEVFDTTYIPNATHSIVEDFGNKFFNTYRGPDLPIVPYNSNDHTKIAPFLDHLKYLLPAPMHYELFLDWAAFTVQYPEERIPWCFLIITSHKGVGKQLVFDMMAKMVGPHNAIQVTKQALSDSNSFNDFMSEKKLIGFDEVHLKGMDFDKLKYLITAPIVEINHKYGAKRVEQVFANMLMFTNHADALQIEHGDRRFFITHCKTAAKTDPGYYSNLFHLVHKTDMPSHFLSFLKARDLSNFAHGETPPVTAAKLHMYEVTVDDLQTDIRDMIADGIGPCQFDIVSAQLVYDYLDAVGAHGTGLSKRSVANYLAMASPPDAELQFGQYQVPDVNGKRNIRVRCKVIRNADMWRSAGTAAVTLEYVRAREALADNKSREQIIEDVRRTYKLEEIK